MSVDSVPDVVNPAFCTDLKEMQFHDSCISRVVQLLKQSPLPDKHKLRTESTEVVKLWCKHPSLALDNGILIRNIIVNDKPLKQIVVPKDFQSTIIKSIHDDMGHPGRDKTLELARQRFYWPGMSQDISHMVKNCRRCICRKSVTEKAPLHPIITTHPLQLVCIDYLLVDPCAGYEHLLVITDHFTKFSKVIPTKNETAKTTAKALYDFFNLYGFPEMIHSDQGRNFESNLIKELCICSGIKKSRTTPYHAMGNGACERMNQTLLKMLGTLSDEKKGKWKEYLNSLIYAYNCTPHDTTGFSPYELMFGRRPHIPIDVALGYFPNDDENESHSKYVSSLKEHIEYCHNLANSKMQSAAAKAKQHYDIKQRGGSLNVGDHVLVKKTGIIGRHKLADRWEDDLHVVLSIPNEDMPVFVVQSLDKKGPKRTVHRNLLLPIGCVIDSDDKSHVGDKPTQNDTVQTKLLANPAKVPKMKDNLSTPVMESDSCSESSSSSSSSSSRGPRRSKREHKPVHRY